MNAEQEAKVERAEMRMVRWMFGVSLREKKTNAELRESMGIEKISDVMRCSRLRWMGHVLRKEGNDWVKKSMEMTVEGSRGRGRPKMTWEKVVERDMKVRGLAINDVKDGVKWRLCHGEQKANSHESGKNGLKMFVVVVVFLHCISFYFISTISSLSPAICLAILYTDLCPSFVIQSFSRPFPFLLLSLSYCFLCLFPCLHIFFQLHFFFLACFGLLPL